MLLSIYAGRIFDLMVLKGDDLAAMGQNQRSRTLPLPADRGPIYDSEGAPLAITVESRNVTADQNLIEDPAEAAARLAPMLGMDQAELQAKLTGDDIFVYVAKGLTPEQWRQIKDLGIQGIFSEKTTKRTYPSGTLAANVLGFVNSEGVGSGGLEMALDSRLKGVDGSRTFEQGAAGQAIPSAEDILRAPQPGQGVQLTINRDIQYVAQRAIATRVREANAESGTVIVLEAKTGRVLAMATAPTFDPNNYLGANKDDMGNRPVSEIYEPGSTGQGADHVGGPRGGQGQADLEDDGPAGAQPGRAHDPRPHRPRHAAADPQRRPGAVEQHRHDPVRGQDRRQEALRVPAQVRHGPADRAAASPARRSDSCPSRRTGGPRPSRPWPTARATRSPRCRWPASTRRSPTTASGSSPG